MQVCFLKNFRDVIAHRRCVVFWNDFFSGCFIGVVGLYVKYVLERLIENSLTWKYAGMA